MLVIFSVSITVIREVPAKVPVGFIKRFSALILGHGSTGGSEKTGSVHSVGGGASQNTA